MSDMRRFLENNPDYIDIVLKAVEYEKENKDPDHAYISDMEYDSCWEYNDIGAHPSKIHQLEVNGITEKVFDTNSTSAYSLRDREKAKRVAEEVNNQFNEGIRDETHEFPSEEELSEMGIFDDVIGYEDVKFLMKRAMSSGDIVNILLLGPPGSAKTVFLMCINKLDNSIYTSGKPTSGPGFMDKMFEETPRFVAIDELDQMEKSDQEILSEYTETGMLVETKGNDKQRSMKTNAKTFAAANSRDKILDNIENRFIDIEFEPYTREEFIRVCEHILPRNEDKTEEEARDIAEAVWDLEGFGNVRKAIQASRLSRGDPEKVLGILDDYSSSGVSSVL